MTRTLFHIAAASLLSSLAASAAFAATPSVSPLPPYSLLTPAAPGAAAVPGRHAVSLTLPGDLLTAGSGAPPREQKPDPTLTGLFVAALELPAGSGESERPAQGTGADADGGPQPQERNWRWRRAGGMEYGVVSVAAVSTAYFEHENGRPTEGNWTSRNEFDEEIRSALRLKSRSARDATDLAGHVIMGVMIAAPVLDSFATLGIRDGEWDAVWQNEMVNLESFTFTSLISSVTQNLLARERPFVRDCRDGDCESNLENRGFPSGHVAFAFTGAGLICNHHRYQSLYNNPAADRAVCSAGIGLAVADGVLRLVADRHYATDIAAGTVLGLFSGFVLPRLLHYSHPTDKASEKKQGARPLIRQLRVLPMFSSSGTGLSCEFRF